MDNIKTVLINHVHSCNKPKDECEKIMVYAMILRQTIIDNNKPVTPPHDVYPSFPKNADKKINKYIVCNQDEPYAELVWQTILLGEDAKDNDTKERVE